MSEAAVVEEGRRADKDPLVLCRLRVFALFVVGGS